MTAASRGVFSCIVEALGTAWVIDERRRLEFVTRDAERLHDRSIDLLRGVPALPELERVMGEAVRSTVEAVFADGRERTVAGPRRDGRWWRTRAAPCGGGVLVHAVDVQEQRDVEERVHAREEHYHRVLRDSGLIVAAVDRDLRYRWIYNPAPQFDPAAVIGRRDYEIADNQGTWALTELKREVIDTGRTLRREITFPLEDGERTYLIRAEPTFDAATVKVDGLTTIAVDVTELRNAQRAASTDYLTGAANRRAFEEELCSEAQRARRYAIPVSLLAVDLDSFKAINDDHGHVAGDAVPREAAQRMREELRSIDTFARWGGEEFFVLLPQVEHVEALRAAERIRRRVSCTPCPPAGAVTVSVGVATLRPGERIEDLVARADGALLRAKAVGRDVVVSDED